MNRRFLRARTGFAATLVAVVTLSAATGGGIGSINRDDLKEWLSYVASDGLQGRALYSSGLGLAAAYIENHLRVWGATPGGDNRTSFLQTVRIQGVKAAGRSTVTVEVGGQRQTFADGAGVTFPKNVGSKRQLTLERVEFSGYGIDAPVADHEDYAGKDVKGAVVLGSAGVGQ